MSQNTIHHLIKLGKKEHIEAFRNGTVFMNSINYFKELEGDEYRGDIQEGIERIEQITYLKILFEGNENVFELRKDSKQNTLLSAQLRVSNPKLEGNIFSMIAITTELLNETDSLDEKNMEFGDSFLVIFNPKEFLRRIDAAAKKLKKSPKWRLVKYYDEKNHNGELDVFHKPIKYKHQNEFRIFMNNNERSSLVLEIGSIEDISEIFEVR